ncbi:hypothetical protein P7K49_033139 [Saguinus oedipus]|uniref:Uncharacterized protein n=1 Tax=Saguinus oedipus TaxID=9490 RepID=A0ABQ9TSS2_SAGOE|nr:hypothetical protein P7K49_033139 [Saguinus oedipus]
MGRANPAVGLLVPSFSTCRMKALCLLLLPVLGLLVSSKKLCSLEEAMDEMIQKGTSSLSENPLGPTSLTYLRDLTDPWHKPDFIPAPALTKSHPQIQPDHQFNPSSTPNPSLPVPTFIHSSKPNPHSHPKSFLTPKHPSQDRILEAIFKAITSIGLECQSVTSRGDLATCPQTFSTHHLDTGVHPNSLPPVPLKLHQKPQDKHWSSWRLQPSSPPAPTPRPPAPSLSSPTPGCRLRRYQLHMWFRLWLVGCARREHMPLPVRGHGLDRSALLSSAVLRSSAARAQRGRRRLQVRKGGGGAGNKPGDHDDDDDDDDDDGENLSPAWFL